MTIDNFDEYLRQGEPDKAEKAKLWKTAIGLQEVDGLKPSAYLMVTARENIEGNITIEEVKQRIDGYYQQHPSLLISSAHFIKFGEKFGENLSRFGENAPE